jgi:hypothetical protein
LETPSRRDPRGKPRGISSNLLETNHSHLLYLLVANNPKEFFMKAKHFYVLGFCLISILLVSCGEPTVFGVPQSQWNSLSPVQKQQVIDGYNQRQIIKTQNEPVDNAINVAGSILNNPSIMRN